MTHHPSAKTKQIIEALHSCQPQKIILFGAWAHGDADAESDLDLILIKETSARFLDRLRDVYSLLTDFGAVDLLVYTPQKVAQMLAEGNAFLKDVLKQGIVLYEKEPDR